MQTALGRMWDRYLGHTNISKNDNNNINDQRPVRTTRYRATLTEKQIPGAEINQMRSEKVIKMAHKEKAATLFYFHQGRRLFLLLCQRQKVESHYCLWLVPRPLQGRFHQQLEKGDNIFYTGCYFKVPKSKIEEHDCNRIAFMSHYGLYRCSKRLSVGTECPNDLPEIYRRHACLSPTEARASLLRWHRGHVKCVYRPYWASSARIATFLWDWCHFQAKKVQVLCWGARLSWWSCSA